MTVDRTISLNDAIAEIRNLYPDMPRVDFNNAKLKWKQKYKAYLECEDAIRELPPVISSAEDMAMQYQRGYIDGFKEGKATFEPKTGHWIVIDEEPHEDYECDKCGYTISTYTANIEPHTEYKYCPNCGARMVAPRNLKYADNDTMMPAT